MTAFFERSERMRSAAERSASGVHAKSLTTASARMASGVVPRKSAASERTASLAAATRSSDQSQHLPSPASSGSGLAPPAIFADRQSYADSPLRHRL